MTGQDQMSQAEQVEAFQRRQNSDLKCLRKDSLAYVSPSPTTKYDRAAWKNSEGETLDDFGVDESIDSNEDDLPLSELIQRRRTLL